MTTYFSPRNRIERRTRIETKRALQALRKEQRREARRDRKGIGAEIDWDASTTGAVQFPSAYDDSNPIVAGVGRTLSRGLR